MAKYEKSFNGNFEEILDIMDTNILRESITATFQDRSNWIDGDIKVAVRIYERYSFWSGSRVSLNLTLVGNGDALFLTVITSGGSRAISFKINTWAEVKFLNSFIKSFEEHIMTPIK